MGGKAITNASRITSRECYSAVCNHVVDRLLQNGVQHVKITNQLGCKMSYGDIDVVLVYERGQTASHRLVGTHPSLPQRHGDIGGHCVVISDNPSRSYLYIC